MSKSWKVTIYSKWEIIYSDQFQKRWIESLINSQAGHIFFHPSLCLAWIETYRYVRDIKPLFCIAIKGDREILFPLVLWKQNWKNAFRRIIIPVGYSDFDYHDPIVNEALNYDEWASFYKSLITTLKKELYFDTILIDGIPTIINEKYWSKEEVITPFCSLENLNSSEKILESLRPSLRGDIKRQIRRIEEKGPISLNSFSDVYEALAELQTFLRFHSARWPGSFKAPKFHENLIKYGLNSGIVHFSTLNCDNEIMSWHLGFKFAGCYYYYMPVIDPKFENFSPGKIHLFKLMEFSVLNGLKVFDHLRGDESYKTGWATNYADLYKFRFVSHNPLSFSRELFCSVKNKIL